MGMADSQLISRECLGAVVDFSLTIIEPPSYAIHVTITLVLMTTESE
jgi:hypothetical protein